MSKTRTPVSLRALVVSLGIVVAGCDDDSMPAQDTGSDSGGSSDSSSDGGSAQMGLRATIDVGDGWVGCFSGHLVGNDDLMVTVTEGSFRLPRTQ